MKKRIVVIGIAAAILFTGLIGFNFTSVPFLKPNIAAAFTEIYTTTANLHVRKAPTTASSILGTVKRNSKLNVMGATGEGWYKVSYQNTTGYVSSQYVKTSSVPAASKYMTTANLNVRSGSSVSYPVLGVLKKGTAISPISKLSNEWYQIQFNGKRGYVSGEYVDSNMVLMNVPVILQRPELPNGCEVVSLTMALNYKGVNRDKITLAKQMPYTKTLDANKGYIGNPFDKTGNTINPVALQILAKKYRSKSADLTGSSIGTIEKEVRAGNPVLVWYTIGYVDPVNHYLYQNGHKYWFPEPLHCIVVTGVSSKYFFINDPWNGNKDYPIEKNRFNQVYSEMGKRALVVR